MTTVRATRESLVAASRRYSRVAHEVEDLAHDVLLSALRHGTLEGEGFLRSLHGAARRHAAFLARTALRRRNREAHAARHELRVDSGEKDAHGAPVSVLPPALRTTLLLLLAGLEKAELRYALGVSDAALRKRFQALRDHAPLARPESAAVAAPLDPRVRRAQVALLPRLADGAEGPRVLATTDPDGHGIIFTEVLTTGRSSATSEAPANEARVLSKGKAC